jgi:homeobox protein ESX1
MRRMDKPEPPPEPRGKPRSAPPLTPQPARERPPASPAEEIGGPKGPEPTRYGDWERKGRVSDF